MSLYGTPPGRTAVVQAGGGGTTRAAARRGAAGRRGAGRWSSARARAAGVAWPGSGPSATPARSCNASGTLRFPAPSRPLAGISLRKYHISFVSHSY